MRMSLLSPLAVGALLGAAGCMPPSTIRVYDGEGGAPRVVTVPARGELDPRGEPAVCLFAWHGNHFMGELAGLRDSGQFRSLYLLTEDHLDPDGCGVLLSIRQGGSRTSASGTSFVEAYSPYGGDLVLRTQADGVFAYRSIVYYLKGELQEGRPLRLKLDELKKSKPLIDEDNVEELAEKEPLTWDGLIAAANENDKAQLEAAKQKAAADDDKEDADDERPADTLAPAEKPWWSKGQ
jgi:hypothetical protein